jgi:hypothetical protein
VAIAPATNETLKTTVEPGLAVTEDKVKPGLWANAGSHGRKNIQTMARRPNVTCGDETIRRNMPGPA